MKTQLQQALDNAQSAPVTVTAPAPTLLQRIAAATTLAVLLQLETEARTSAEQGAWLIYLDRVSTLHAAVVSAKVNAAATKAAADAAAAQAAVDALLQSSILKLVDKFAPMLASVPALLAQVQPALDAYRASRVGIPTTPAVVLATVANFANMQHPAPTAPVVSERLIDGETVAQRLARGLAS